MAICVVELVKTSSVVVVRVTVLVCLGTSLQALFASNTVLKHVSALYGAD